MNNLQFSSLPKLEILPVLEREGADVIRRGKTLWIRHHGEKTASCKIFNDRFHCFGCGKHGDAIDYVMELHGFSFKDACRYLNIIPGKPIPIDPQKAKQRQLLKAFEAWQRQYYCQLCNQLIDIHNLRIKAERRKPLPEAIGFWLAEKLAEIPLIELQLDILSGNDEQAKLNLFKAVIK
ncbi:MAG: CHC2 zinc finger domain-containing protein [Smithella sp.]